MGTLTKRVLAETLTQWNIIYPNQKSASELSSVGEAWHRAFKNFSESVFVEAARRYTETARYFPTPGDIRLHIDEILAQKYDEPKPLPKSRRIEDQPATSEEVGELLKVFRNKFGNYGAGSAMTAKDRVKRQKMLKRQAKELKRQARELGEDPEEVGERRFKPRKGGLRYE